MPQPGGATGRSAARANLFFDHRDPEMVSWLDSHKETF
jgi:hypothetical protein